MGSVHTDPPEGSHVSRTPARVHAACLVPCPGPAPGPARPTRARPRALAAMHSGHTGRAGSRWSWVTSGGEAVADHDDGARAVLQATKRESHKRSIRGACPRGEAPCGHRPGVARHSARCSLAVIQAWGLLIHTRTWVPCAVMPHVSPACGSDALRSLPSERGHTRTVRRYRCAVAPRSPVPWARLMGPAVAVPRRRAYTSHYASRGSLATVCRGPTRHGLRGPPRWRLLLPPRCCA